jgi:hypothetical protein
MGKREGDESGEDIEILGDMMSVVNVTRFSLVQELDKNKERRTGYNSRHQMLIEEEVCAEGEVCA